MTMKKITVAVALMLFLVQPLSLGAGPEEGDVEGAFESLVSRDRQRTRVGLLDLHAMAGSSDTLLNALIEGSGLYRSSAMEGATDLPDMETRVLTLCLVGSLDRPMATDTLLSLVNDPTAEAPLRTCAAYFLKDRMNERVQAGLLRAIRATAPEYKGLCVPAMILAVTKGRGAAATGLVSEIASAPQAASPALVASALSCGLYSLDESERLVGTLLRRPYLDPHVQGAVLFACARLGISSFEKELSALDVSSLDTPSKVFLALSLSGSGPGAPLLDRLATDDDTVVAAAALSSRVQAAKDPAVDLKGLRSLCKDRRLRAQDRALALWALCSVEGEEVSLCSWGLESPDPEIRQASVKALGFCQDEVVAASLAERVKTESDPAVLADLLTVVAPERLESLNRELKRTSEPGVLCAALRAAAQRPELFQRSIGVVQDLVRHENPDVREQALRALAAAKPSLALVPRDILESNLITHLTASAEAFLADPASGLVCHRVPGPLGAGLLPRGAREALLARLVAPLLERAIGLEALEQAILDAQLDCDFKFMACETGKKPAAPKAQTVEKSEKKETKEPTHSTGGKKKTMIRLKAVDPKDVGRPEVFKCLLKNVVPSSVPQWIREGKSLGEHIMESPVEYQVEILERRMRFHSDCVKSLEKAGKTNPDPWAHDVRMSPEAEKLFLQRNPGAPRVLGTVNMYKRDVDVEFEGTKKGGAKKVEPQKEEKPKKIPVEKEKKPLVDWRQYRVTPADVFRSWVDVDADFRLLAPSRNPARKS